MYLKAWRAAINEIVSSDVKVIKWDHDMCYPFEQKLNQKNVVGTFVHIFKSKKKICTFQCDGGENFIGQSVDLWR